MLGDWPRGDIEVGHCLFNETERSVDTAFIFPRCRFVVILVTLTQQFVNFVLSKLAQSGRDITGPKVVFQLITLP